MGGRPQPAAHSVASACCRCRCQRRCPASLPGVAVPYRCCKNGRSGRPTRKVRISRLQRRPGDQSKEDNPSARVWPVRLRSIARCHGSQRGRKNHANQTDLWDSRVLARASFRPDHPQRQPLHGHVPRTLKLDGRLLNVASIKSHRAYRPRRAMFALLLPFALTGAMYRSYCAVVTQYDRNWMWLTAREHVSLAHAFYQADLDGHGIEKRTTALLEQCGLTSCAGLCGTERVSSHTGTLCPRPQCSSPSTEPPPVCSCWRVRLRAQT